MRNVLSTAPVFVPLFAAAVALSIIIGTPRAATAQTPTESTGAALSAQGMQTFRTLEKVDYFAVGGVGIAGRTSEGELALRALLKEKNGPTVLRGLFKTATPSGKLYALLGLKQTGTARVVAEVAGELNKRKEMVRTLRGCIGGRETLGALATQIEHGKIVLPPERVKQPAK